MYGDDVIGYFFDFDELLVVEGGGVEDFGGDVGIVDGGVGVYGVDEDFDLGVDVFFFFGVFVDDGEGIDVFVVEIYVFGEWLGESNVVILGDKVVDGKGIFVDVIWGKVLVGYVEEGVVIFGFDGCFDFFLLFGSRVDIGGVVGVGVEEEDGVVGGFVDVGDYVFEVEVDGFFVVVGVFFYGEVGIFEDGGVVGLWGLGNVDGFCVGEEFGEESVVNVEGVSIGDGLGDGDMVEGWGVFVIGENGSSFGEFGDIGDVSVFFVEVWGNYFFFSLMDRG